MKVLKNISKQALVNMCVLSSLCLLISSCAKKYNNIGDYNPPTSYMTFIDASPDTPPVNFSIDGQKVNTSSVIYGSGINYFEVVSGARLMDVRSALSNAAIVSDSIRLIQNQSYSLYLGNTYAHPELLLFKDTLTQPSAGKANVRFINLSPDAGAVDLVLHGGATITSNKAFKGYSAFVPVAANASYTIEVKQAGTNTILASMPSVYLYGNYIYTIWLRGLSSTSTDTQKLGISMTANAFY